MKAHVLCFLALFVLGCELDSASDSRLGGIRLAPLSTTECAAYCVESLSAELYREGEVVPLGPPVVVACGEPAIFADLPAGHRVRLRVSLHDGVFVRLTGWSEAVTVAANAETPVTVPLEATSPPVIQAIAPDPAPSGTAEITLTGSGFGPFQNQSTVSVGTPTEWTQTRLSLALPTGVPTDRLSVIVCGLESDPVSIRVLRSKAASVPIPVTPCEGAVITGVAAGESGASVVVACATGGRLLRVSAVDCSVTSSSAALDAAPTAVTVDGGSEIVAVADGRVLRITGTQVDALAWPTTEVVTRLAAESGAIAGVDPLGAAALDAEGAATRFPNADGQVAIDAAPVDGGTALLVRGPSGPEVQLHRQSPARVDVPLKSCTAPSGIAHADHRIAVTCDDALIWLDAESLDTVRLVGGGSGRPALAGGVAFAPGPLGLRVYSNTQGIGLITTDAPARLAALPGGVLAVVGDTGSSLAIVSPYLGQATCGIAP